MIVLAQDNIIQLFLCDVVIISTVVMQMNIKRASGQIWVFQAS